MFTHITKAESVKADFVRRQSEPAGVQQSAATGLRTETAILFPKAKCACDGGCPACQSKSALNISRPNDPAEIEADAIADRVMRMSIDDVKPESSSPHSSDKIQRKCDVCEDDQEEDTENPLMRKDASVSAMSKTPLVDKPTAIATAVKSGGRPLDLKTRRFFEPRFGVDLGHVRVHTDTLAAETAHSISAKAYTLGNDIVFGSGEYKPQNESGKHLLAHELAHVVQSPHSRFSSATTLHRKSTGTGSKSDPNVKDSEFVMKSIMEIINGVDRSDPAKWKGHPLFTRYRDLFVLWYEITQGKATGSGAKLEGEAFLARFEKAKARTQEFLIVVLKQSGGTYRQLLVDKYQPKVIEFEKRADSERRIIELTKAKPTTPVTPGKPVADKVPSKKISEVDDKSSEFLAPVDLVKKFEDAMNQKFFGKLAGVLVDAVYSHPTPYNYVFEVFEAIRDWDSDYEDNLGAEFINQLPKSKLEQFANDRDGRQTLSLIYEAIITGDVSAFEREQANKVLMAKAQAYKPDDYMSLSRVRENGRRTRIFPIRFMRVTPGNDYAPPLAKLVPNGHIRVKYPVSVLHMETFKAEVATLEGGFFQGEGEEINPNEIVGIKDYERGGVIQYLPALALIDYSNQAIHSTGGKIFEVSVFAATLGIGGGAVAGGGVAATEVRMTAIWATRLTKAATVLDRVANVIGIASFVINENRDWIIRKLGKRGKQLVEITEVANSVAGVYGIGRLAHVGYKIVEEMQTASKAARLESKILTSEENIVLKRLDDETDAMLKELDESAVKSGDAPQKKGNHGQEAAKLGDEAAEISKAFDPEDLAEIGAINDDTVKMFKEHPGRLRAWAEYPEAAQALKFCESPCWPANITKAEQIQRLDAFVREARANGIKFNRKKLHNALETPGVDVEEIIAGLEHKVSKPNMTTAETGVGLDLEPDMKVVERPPGKASEAQFAGDLGEGLEAAGAGAKKLPTTYAKKFSPAAREELRGIFSAEGDRALGTFVNRLELPPEGLAQVEIPTSVGLRRVDRLFKEGNKTVLREVKNYTKGILKRTDRITSELDKDISILRRFKNSDVRIDWQINGSIDRGFLEELELLEKEWPGRFHLIRGTPFEVVA